MANEIIMSINKKAILENARKYNVTNIIELCDNILGVMAYNESDSEYNFIVETVYPDIPYANLPSRYLPKAAQIIKDTINTEDVALARAKVYYNMAHMSFRNGDMDTYDKYHKMLVEMVRDKAVSKEFLRDLYGSISAN